MSFFSRILIKKSEFLMILAGCAILVSVFVVSNTGDFTYWWIAKACYVIGVVLIVVEVNDFDTT